MSEFSIVVPEVAAGRAVAQKLFVEFTIQNEVQTLAVGDIVLLTQSLLAGTIIKVSSLGTVTAHVFILLDNESPEIIVQGENITVKGITYAQVRNTAILSKYYSQKTTLVGGNNQFNDIYINRYGALRTTFESGSPQVDSIGRLQTTGKTILGKYEFIRVEDPSAFFKIIVGGSSTTFDADASLLVLSNGLGITDSVQIFSNLYHHNVLSTSMLINFKVVVGDSGKANVIREWGYYDTKDGILFRLNGTQFQIVLRSFSTGVLVETIINQQDFSDDVLDGTQSTKNNSRETFNIATVNSYWIDIDSSSRIRCGIILAGNRIVMHVFNNAGSGLTNQLRRYSLPVTLRQENTGLPSSGSEIRFISATVSTESAYSPNDGGLGTASNTTAITVIPGGWVPLLTIQPQSFTHGYIIAVAVSLYTHLAGVDKPCRIGIFANAVLTGAVFIPASALAEIDESATSFTGGKLIYEIFVTGTRQIEFKTIINNTKKYLYNYADGSQQSFTIAAMSFDASNVDVFSSFNWEEINI